ncbi:hypothetical protein BHE74_00008781 [Ensete ventricosum]|nr:hypothetical protein BHE74_00008781 [Ensete ventricosum]
MIESHLDVLEASLEELYQGPRRLLGVESSQEEAESRIDKVESQVDRLTEDTKNSVQHLHEVMAELTSKLLSWGTSPQHVRSAAHDSPSEELGLIPLGYLSCWSNFHFRILPSGSFGDHYPLRLLCLVEQTLHCSASANALARLRLFANIAPAAPFKA